MLKDCQGAVQARVNVPCAEARPQAGPPDQIQRLIIDLTQVQGYALAAELSVQAIERIASGAVDGNQARHA